MIIKIHEAHRYVVAVCDSELLGKVFEADDERLDLTTTFFKGDEVSRDELLELLDFYKHEDASFNFAGQEACDLAVELGLINEDCVREMAGVPIALVLL